MLVKLYLLTIPVFFAIDVLWIGYLAKNLYRDNIGHLLAPSVNWPAAIVFYLIYIGGILLFAVLPALEKESLRHAVTWGALFGFFTYMTYDMTNLATAKDFPLKVAIIDMIWGTVLCCGTATASYFIGTWLKG